MSWNSYVDSIIGASAGQCDKACIIGLDGSPWTTDDNANNLHLTSEEAATVARVVRSEDQGDFQCKGINISGVKYPFLRGDKDERVYIGKKKDCGFITIHASKSAIVIGHTVDGGDVGSVNKGITAIVEYLESLNM